MNYMILPLKRFFDFSGRSRRKEYWMFTLFQIIVYTAVVLLTGVLGAGADTAGVQGSDDLVAVAAAGLGVGIALPAILFFIPGLAVVVRRFHDQGKTGWLVLLSFIPFLGGLIVLFFMCVEGTRGPNRYGHDPKNALDIGDTFA